MSPFKNAQDKNEYQKNLMRKRRGTPIKVCANCNTAYQGHKCPECKNGKGKVVKYGI